MRVLKKEIWPYSIKVNFSNDFSNDFSKYQILNEWCIETFGYKPIRWIEYDDSGKDYHIYAFKEEADFIIFKLRYK